MKKIKLCFSFVLISFLLTACGQMGPLYLPPPPKQGSADHTPASK